VQAIDHASALNGSLDGRDVAVAVVVSRHRVDSTPNTFDLAFSLASQSVSPFFASASFGNA